MLFSTSTTTALLSLAASALAAPQHAARQAAPLSLTAQLTLADTATDRYNLLTKDSDFAYDWNKPGANPFANRKSFPALVGAGTSLAYATIPPCTFGGIHVHPRGNEVLAIVDGRITNYMIPETGVLSLNPTNSTTKTRVVTNVVSAGMAVLNPQGALHTLYNYDCEVAKGVAGFSSEDVGITLIPQSLFAAPDDVVSGQLGGVEEGQVVAVRELVGKNTFKIEECLARCNIK